MKQKSMSSNLEQLMEMHISWRHRAVAFELQTSELHVVMLKKRSPRREPIIGFEALSLFAFTMHEVNNFVILVPAMSIPLERATCYYFCSVSCHYALINDSLLVLQFLIKSDRFRPLRPVARKQAHTQIRRFLALLEPKLLSHDSLTNPGRRIRSSQI